MMASAYRTSTWIFEFRCQEVVPERKKGNCKGSFFFVSLCLSYATIEASVEYAKVHERYENVHLPP